MRQTQSIISTYTADVSGVCSALFELGGLVVMHDASGCNSTYNTHDEPRWYNYDSMVYISGLSELEALMGDDAKLRDDIIDSVKELKPAFSAIAGTPIPMMTGCDLPAIAREIEEATGVPCFGFQTNGMHSYVQGAGMALEMYAKRMIDKNVSKIPGTVNIMGVTPVDFSVNGAAESLKKPLEDGGWQVLSTWAMGSTPQELKASGAAAVNLVVSAVGLPAAKAFKEMFGTPYVIGTPFGDKFSETVLEALKESASDGQDRAAFGDFVPAADARILIIGESVISRSLAAALKGVSGLEARVICPVETYDGVLSERDMVIEDEEDIAEAFKSADIVVGDPLFKPVLQEGIRFVPLPHEGFSGRTFRKSIPNLVTGLEDFVKENF